MAKTSRGLGKAHRGYIYQDIATAYFMASCLVEQSGTLIVDRKLVDDDRFDDLSIQNERGFVRRQFKRSDNENRPLSHQDFTQEKHNLRLDNLILTHLRMSTRIADEYRLCVTWIFSSEEAISSALIEVPSASSFAGYRTRLFRLNPDEIWPEKSISQWSPLRKGLVTREQFVEFSERFIIELGCPHASTDFKTPSQLEMLIIDMLRDKVGIGRYPNQHLDPADVAEQLAWRAYQARTRSEEVTLADIEKHLRLRRDYGREAQIFPVIKEAYVKRDRFIHLVETTVSTSDQTVVVGPPGSGKSWTLDQLAEKMKREGHLVARHYCYIEPGDDRVEKRVTTNVLFANLIAELVDEAPKLREKSSYLYSAGLEELESILPHAVEASPTGQVYLFVDGLDHIARVVSEKRSLAVDETDIIEEIAVLKKPLGVHLVAGSQPGIHLAPLNETSTLIQVPEWEQGDIKELAEKLGVTTFLNRDGFDSLVDEFLVELANRTDGNPLYATYLCEEIKNFLRSRDAVDPLSFLKTLPTLSGNISRYYDHLLNTIDRSGEIIANVLGAIDFGVTENELSEILPGIGYHVPRAVRRLSPVLKQVSTQGGIRIYHESFRRHILERLKSEGIPLGKVIAPIIIWLDSLGFWKDAKAFRFLLPLLRISERYDEILQLVDYDFVSKSIEAGHYQRSIETNLNIAVDVAAEQLNWVALGKYAQLRRAIETCFEEHLDPEAFGRTFGELFGFEALSQRLLFEGRTTTTRTQGLVLCSICDDAGVVAPWKEYLELPDLNERNSREENIDAAVAEFQGRLRLEGPNALFPRLLRFLNDVKEEPDGYVRRIFRIYAEKAGQELTTRLLRRIRTPRNVLVPLTIEYIRVLHQQGERDTAIKLTALMLNETTISEEFCEIMLLGANIEILREHLTKNPNLEKQLTTTPPDGRDAKNAEKWVASVGLLAQIAPKKLEDILQQISYEGWYGLWLRYIVAFSKAQCLSSENADKASLEILNAFRDLASDTYPFRGSPRACDLYPLWSLIHRTISRGLALLKSNSQWIEASKILVEISTGTTTYLQGSQSGPLTPDALAALIMPYLAHPELKPRVIDLLEEQVRNAEKHGEYYAVHARHEMFLARALKAAENRDDALDRWKKASQFLCSYGMRKDIALFDILECGPTLSKFAASEAQTRFAQAQELTEIVVSHTDGKETIHTPNAWFRALCKADPIGAIFTLYHSLVREGGRHHWMLENAVGQVVEDSGEDGDPVLRAYLCATQPLVEDGLPAAERLAVVDSLHGYDESQWLQLFKILSTQVQGDADEFSTKEYDLLEKYASDHGISIPPGRLVIGREETQNQSSYQPPEKESKDAFNAQEIFSESSTPIEILAWLRQQNRYRSDEEDFKRFNDTFVKRIKMLILEGKTHDAMRILRYTARHFSFGTRAWPLGQLAELLEEEGCGDIAAAAWTLAYARSKGGGGWLTLGGERFNSWIQKGINISKEVALQILASEVGWLIQGGASFGVARHLIEMCAECISGDLAINVWDATYQVLKHRLPESEPTIAHIFVPYVPGSAPNWTLNEALFVLLLGRVSHPELKRKVAALAGCAKVVSANPTVTIPGYKHLLSRDTPFTSSIVTLQTLAEFEQPPFVISRSLSGYLQECATSTHFALRWLALAILERIGERPATVPSMTISKIVLPVSPQQRQQLRYLDRGNRIDLVAEYWPSFPSEVLRVFDGDLFSSEIQQKRARDRHQLSRSRVYRIPPTELLFWEHEIFELAFQQVLTGITDQLRTQGLWEPDVEYSLLFDVLPKLTLHVGHWHSRVMRPSIPLPNELAESIGPTEPISNEDNYNGWYRCAYHEEELVLGEGYSRDVSERVTTYQGVVFSPDPLSSYTDHLPLGIGRSEVWLDRMTGPLDISPFTGPLVGFDFTADFLGRKPLFIPHPSISARCNLQPEERPGPLTLLDRDGHPAIIFRHWHVRALGSRIGEETPQLIGCDLIIRPDTFERITRMGDYPPVTVCRVTKRPVDID